MLAGTVLSKQDGEKSGSWGKSLVRVALRFLMGRGLIWKKSIGMAQVVECDGY